MLSALFWNIWGHRNPAGINKHIADAQADINCLTEVTDTWYDYDPMPLIHSSKDRGEPPSAINGRAQLLNAFQDHYRMIYSSPRYTTWECHLKKETYKGIGFGSTLLYRHGLITIARDSILILLNDEKWRVLQYLVVEHEGRRYLIAHLHGVWVAHNTKGDDPLRTTQSVLVLKHVSELSRNHNAPHIVFGGDLNLDHNTHALALLEQGFEGMPLRNLIREYGVQNTRTPAYRKFSEPGTSLFADYVLVSPNVKVHEFIVDTSVLASDHAPLQITFS